MDLDDIFKRRERPGGDDPPQLFEAIVAETATELGQAITVRIPAFDGGATRFPVWRWAPVGELMPERGCDALVAVSNRRRLWLVFWTPKGP